VGTVVASPRVVSGGGGDRGWAFGETFASLGCRFGAESGEDGAGSWVAGVGCLMAGC